MGLLVTVVGNSGVGKTTFVRCLSTQGGFSVGYEDLNDRPFQISVQSNPGHYLGNQIDFLLYRANQEYHLRQEAGPCVMDGGVDVDYHVWTRLFFTQGRLSRVDYDLCRRLYQLIRIHQPVPEGFIFLQADQKTIITRLANRQRINIATENDLPLIHSLLSGWLSEITPNYVLHLDASNHDPEFHSQVPLAMNWIRRLEQSAS